MLSCSPPPRPFPIKHSPPRRYCCSPANSAPFQSCLESPPPNCAALWAPFSQGIHDQMTSHCMLTVVQGLGQSSQCPLYTGTQCPSNPWGFTWTYSEKVGSDGLESKTTQCLCSHRCLSGPPSPPPLCPVPGWDTQQLLIHKPAELTLGIKSALQSPGGPMQFTYFKNIFYASIF